MPYLVETENVDSRSVKKEFEPEIDQRVMALITLGRNVTEEEVNSLPGTLLVSRPQAGAVPDIIGWNIGPFIVSQQVKDKIDELEPKVHEYAPIELRNKDGQRIRGQNERETYYMILRPPQLDAIIVEKTDFNGGRGRAGFNGRELPSVNTAPGLVCTLDRTAIAGHHFWRAPAPMAPTYFCSDELHDFIKARKLHGWSFHRCECAGE